MISYVVTFHCVVLICTSLAYVKSTYDYCALTQEPYCFEENLNKFATVWTLLTSISCLFAIWFLRSTETLFLIFFYMVTTLFALELRFLYFLTNVCLDTTNHASITTNAIVIDCNVYGAISLLFAICFMFLLLVVSCKFLLYNPQLIHPEFFISKFAEHDDINNEKSDIVTF